MKETIVDPWELEGLFGREAYREYLKSLDPDGDEKTFLEALVEALPEDEGMVVRLKFWDGMEAGEISDWTGMDRRKVELLLQRGLDHLGEELLDGAALSEEAA